jgi:hypothetical protein
MQLSDYQAITNKFLLIVVWVLRFVQHICVYAQGAKVHLKKVVMRQLKVPLPICQYFSLL